MEQAISTVHEPGSKTPSSALKTKLKRLLETDRKLGRNPRARDPEKANYAFFTTEAPGSGVEVWFSGYEVFALYTALRLLEHGLPQTESTLVLRRARPLLEPKHVEIIQWLAKPPGAAVSALRLYLNIITPQGNRSDPDANPVRTVQVRDGDFAVGLEGDEARVALTSLELVTEAKNIHRALEKTSPTKRGRPGE
jgi:hypothetical protein